jgi:hypothetical protein
VGEDQVLVLSEGLILSLKGFQQQARGPAERPVPGAGSLWG